MLNRLFPIRLFLLGVQRRWILEQGFDMFFSSPVWWSITAPLNLSILEFCLQECFCAVGRLCIASEKSQTGVSWLLRMPAPSHHFTATAGQRWQSAVKPKICHCGWASLPASSGQCHLSYFHPQMPQHGQKSYESSRRRGLGKAAQFISALWPQAIRADKRSRDPIYHQDTRSQASWQWVHTPDDKDNLFYKATDQRQEGRGHNQWARFKDQPHSQRAQSSPVHYSHSYCPNLACCDLL